MKNFDRAPKKEAISTVDPDDVEEDPTKGRCMLTPTAPIKMKWDIVMLFLILYNVIMVPVRICFEVEAPAGSIEFWLETFFDMLFIVDIVLNFNSAYVNDEGSLETNRSKIASTYLRGWFLIDGPSSLPTEPVMELIGLAIPDLGIGSTAPEPEGCVTEGGGDTAMMMPKLLRFLRMIRFMKLIRLLKAAKIFKVMEEELDVNMSVLKLFKLVFIVVFLGHLIACFVFLANKAAQDAVVDSLLNFETVKLFANEAAEGARYDGLTRLVCKDRPRGCCGGSGAHCVGCRGCVGCVPCGGVWPLGRPADLIAGSHASPRVRD